MSVVPWQCGDDAEVKTWHLIPTMSPAPIGRGYKRLVHNAHHFQAQSPWGCDSDQSSLCAQRVAKDPSFLHADIEDSDQTGRMTRLILVFDGRTSLVLSCTGGGNHPPSPVTNVSTNGKRPRRLFLVFIQADFDINPSCILKKQIHCLP